MDRVLVMGPPGAGKSTLARSLAGATGLPPVHLDAHFWLPGWVPSDTTTWPARVAALAAADRWIIEGNYLGTLSPRLARADAVILLEPPRWKCVLRVIRRTIENFGRVRSDMPEGCPERFEPDFLRYVMHFHRSDMQRLREAVDAFDGAVYRCHSNADVRVVLTGLGAAYGSGSRPESAARRRVSF